MKRISMRSSGAMRAGVPPLQLRQAARSGRVPRPWKRDKTDSGARADNGDRSDFYLRRDIAFDRERSLSETLNILAVK